jgi:hypothetical protein
MMHISAKKKKNVFFSEITTTCEKNDILLAIDLWESRKGFYDQRSTRHGIVPFLLSPLIKPFAEKLLLHLALLPRPEYKKK